MSSSALAQILDQVSQNLEPVSNLQLNQYQYEDAIIYSARLYCEATPEHETIEEAARVLNSFATIGCNIQLLYPDKLIVVQVDLAAHSTRPLRRPASLSYSKRPCALPAQEGSPDEHWPDVVSMRSEVIDDDGWYSVDEFITDADFTHVALDTARECGICLCEFVLMRVTKCQHTFCTNCTQHIINYNIEKCPMCRANISNGGCK